MAECCTRRWWPKENQTPYSVTSQKTVWCNQLFIKIPDGLPAGWEITLSSYITLQNSSPTGIRRDFNCLFALWRLLRFANCIGQIDSAYVPTVPNIADYPDVNSAQTITPPIDCSTVVYEGGDQCIIYNHANLPLR